MPTAGVTSIDAAGATLMPGMTRRTRTFAWNDQPGLNAIQRMPTEEHILWCAHIAKRYLDMGFTSCVGAATAKPRLDVVIRNAIESGQIPGPRYLAASQEITVPGGLGDETLPHLPYPEFSFGAVVSGVEEMRKCVRMFLKYGVDTIKLNLSGEYIAGIPAEFTPMTDAEIAMAVEEAQAARQARRGACALERIGQAVRAPRHRAHLPRELRRRGSARHAGGGQGPALRRARHRLADQHVVPREPSGASRPRCREGDGLSPRARDRVRDRSQKMHKRGIRILPGGDYGFAWIKHGTNAKDLEYFVKYLGFTPMEALLAATKLGGQIMMRGRRARPGEGRLPRRPAAGRRRSARRHHVLLQDKARILAVMKDGVFHKAARVRSARSVMPASVA